MPSQIDFLKQKIRNLEGEKFVEGVTWHNVTADCDCGQECHLVADELNEDCNAYNTANEIKGRCEDCGKKKQVHVINKTDRPNA